MSWVALDRGIALADLICADTQVECWTCVRDDIRTAILTQGWNADIGAFTQVFGGSDLDASTLLIALVGILPADDIRLHSTITAIIAGCPITAACSTATAATTDWVVKRDIPTLHILAGRSVGRHRPSWAGRAHLAAGGLLRVRSGPAGRIGE